MASEEAGSNKRQKEECTIDCLPSDIIERVFLRFPLDALLRCAGVCKQWRNIIQDPQFVSSQLQRAPRYALLFFPQESVSRQPYPSDAILIDEAWSQSTCAVPVIGPDEFLFGSCNGLLGLYTKTSTIKIANFTTGQCLHLEKPVKNLRGDHFSLYTFGFHPATKQYKITHFLPDCIESVRRHDNDRVSVIQVYTLGDEKWKDIRTPEALSLKRMRNSGVVNTDGTLYWLTGGMIASSQHAIMSFDLSEDSFARIQLPSVLHDFAHGYSRLYWIREIDGKICIATAQTSSYLPRWLVDKLQIWTLDNKREHMWSHKYNLHYQSDCILGPNFVHGDRIIMQNNYGGCLCSYELSGEDYDIYLSKMSRLLDFRPRKHKLQSHNCVKSLVRLDGFKKAGIVRMQKQRDGWELKKWQSWEQKLSKMETMWCKVHQEEHKEIAFAQSMRIKLNRLLPRISDDVLRQHIGMEINQILPAFSNQQARPIRRFNLGEHMWDMENLVDHLENLMHITKAMAQAIASVGDMIGSATPSQEFEQYMCLKLSRLLPQKISNDVMRQHIGMKANQIFTTFPSQQPRSLQRLNWVEHQRDMENLFGRLENFVHITAAMAMAIARIGDTIRSATQDQKGTPISEVSVASENQSDHVDTELRLGSLSRHFS